METTFCNEKCPVKDKTLCKLDSVKDVDSFFEKNHLKTNIQEIIKKISKKNSFTLRMMNFKCGDKGLSCSYEIWSNDSFIDTLVFTSEKEICFPFYCIHFLSILKKNLEASGFSSKYTNYLEPYSEISFNKRCA